MTFRRRTIRRHAALLALVLLAVAQLSFAAMGCFADRTAAVMNAESEVVCVLETLMCATHCQAEEQVSDAGTIPVLGLEQLPIVMTATARISVDRPARVTVRPPVPRSVPPPTLLFARLLN